MICRSLLAVVLLIVVGSPAVAWWEEGHIHIADKSLQHLPPVLRTFINRNLSTVEIYAGNEPPGAHYIDIDVYPEFHAGTMPRDLQTLYNTHGTSNVNAEGIAPWTIANYRTSLTSAMRVANTQSGYTQIARIAGELAHYVGDINQPLHTTQNYNGQMTGNSGIHARYEGNMIDRRLQELIISPAPQNCVYITDTVDWILDSIEDRTWDYVDDIMTADTLARTFGSTNSNGYYNSLWSSTGAFTKTQFQYASEMVASVWYSAWVDAGRPMLGVSGDFNGDSIVDAADYVVWRKTNASSVLNYEVWRTTFGNTIAGAGGGSSTVPEPAALSAIAIVSLAAIAGRRTPRPQP